MIFLHFLRRVALAATSVAAGPLRAADVTIAPASAAAIWTGGSADSALVRDNASPIRWEPSKSPSLTLRPAVADLSTGGAILIWVHSSQARGDWLNVAVMTRGNRSQKEEADTVSGWVQITWTGWQEVLLPRKAFKSAPGKRRTNWRDVQRIGFSFPERSAPGLVLHFGDVRVGDPVGPRLSDRELLDLVDLNRPELAEVRRVAGTGDTAVTLKALAAYYRQRRTVKWWFDPQQRDPASVKPDLKSIDAMMAGNLTIIYRRFPFRGGVADWHINPTAGQPNQTDEWLWSLNRMDYWKYAGGHQGLEGHQRKPPGG